MRFPAPLAVGARVALVAPAGRIDAATDIPRALENTRSLGWQGIAAPHAALQSGYFAGDDAQRLADLNAALRDESIDAIWSLRGGYGMMRILDQVDYRALRARPRAVIGYSDITALHLAVSSQCDLVTFHGPVARANITPFARESLRRATAGEDPFIDGASPRALSRGRATGRLAGGNLALLAALCGTRYAPRFDGAIVVIEDVYEAVYRIDRMLMQLRLAGAFDGCAAIGFGQFTELPEEDPSRNSKLEEVLCETAEILGVPALSGLPIGHVDDQWTVPLGAMAELDADAGTVRLLEGAERGGSR